MDGNNQLFEELLGENASAIGSIDQKAKDGGEESTAMSSVIGPILRAKTQIPGATLERHSDALVSGGEVMAKQTSEGRGGGLGGTLNYNSGNHPTLNQLKQSRPHQQPQPQQQRWQTQAQTHNRDDAADTDADTFMTKPREIAFDSSIDDVSTMFGGQGGVSGVESYLGTTAEKRRNRHTAATGSRGRLALYGAAVPPRQAGRASEERTQESRRTGRTGGTSAFVSAGVTTILEEIGLGTKTSAHRKKEKTRGSVCSDDDGYTDGYTEEFSKEEHRGWPRTSRPNGAFGGRRKKRGEPRRSILRSLLRLDANRLLVLGVGVLFAAVQITTVRRRDRAMMDHLHRGFRNGQRYSTAGDAPADLARRRREYVKREISAARVNTLRHGVNDATNGADAEPRLREHEEPDGAARQITGYSPFKEDVARTVNNAAQRPQGLDSWERERDRVLLDDGMGANSDARNHWRGNAPDNPAIFPGKQQQPWYPPEQKAQPLPEQRQLQQQQLQMIPPPQQQIQETPPVMQQISQSQNELPLSQGDRLGDTDLLPPHESLPAVDALTEHGNPTDKLSDILPPLRHGPSSDLIPPRYRVLADVRSPYILGKDTPFFWHIPRSGGVVVKTMLSHCLGQVLAAEVGELDGHGADMELKVVSFSQHNYTNVNIATPEGISRAANLGLVQSHLAHTLVSAHVDLISTLFKSNDQARAFTLLRHPVERAASMFYFLQKEGMPELQKMTIDDYAKSDLIENNWLVRILSESMTGPIDMDNLEIAKKVLRKKFVVGLLDNKRGSFARFDHYFKWNESPNYEKEFGCRKQLMDEKYAPSHPVRKNSDTWKLLLEQNRFDVHLYDYASDLFKQQSYMFGL